MAKLKEVDTNTAQQPRIEDWKSADASNEAKLPATTDAAGQVPAPVTTSSIDDMLAEDSAMGKENITLTSMAIPRLSVLQPLSPQCLEGKSEYMPEAKPGMIYDSVAHKIYSGAKGIRCIPVNYRFAHLEWIPRNAGGGFVADHGADATILAKCTPNDKKMMMTPEGHEIIGTHEYYVYVYNDEDNTVFQAVISMAKTQSGKARGWNTSINQLEIEHPKGSGKMINPAMFYRSYVLTTKPEQNDQGMWFGWIITPAEMVPMLPRGSELYLKARQFYKDIAAGKVEVAKPVEMGGNQEESEDLPM